MMVSGPDLANHFSNRTPACAFPTSPVWDLTAAPFSLALQGGPQVPTTQLELLQVTTQILQAPLKRHKLSSYYAPCIFFSVCPRGNLLPIDGLGKKAVHGSFCRGNANVTSRAGNQRGNSSSGRYRQEDGGGCLPSIASNCLSSEYLSCHGATELSLQPSLVPCSPGRFRSCP